MITAGSHNNLSHAIKAAWRVSDEGEPGFLPPGHYALHVQMVDRSLRAVQLEPGSSRTRTELTGSRPSGSSLAPRQDQAILSRCVLLSNMSYTRVSSVDTLSHV